MVALCVVVWFVLRRTTFGFETITVGTNPHAARYAGINVNRIIVLAMVLSGGFAGLAAASEVAGTNGFFQPGTFAFIGFDGIAIALLARTNPLAIIPASLLWGALLAGAPLMQQEADVSIDVVRIIQSMVLLFVAADAIVRFVFRIEGEGGPALDAAGDRMERRREQRDRRVPLPGRLVGTGPDRGTGAGRRRSDAARSSVACSACIGLALAPRLVAPNLSSETKAFAFEPPPDPLQVSFNPVVVVTVIGVFYVLVGVSASCPDDSTASLVAQLIAAALADPAGPRPSAWPCRMRPSRT